MVRVNYQREKRRKDLDRQKKQEEKRAKKIIKDLEVAADGSLPGSPEEPAVPGPAAEPE